MNVAVPQWDELLVALLLLSGGALALTGAIGLLRYGDFFRRMHPPALAATLSAACVTLASCIHFTVLEQQLALYPLLINALLAITTPVTTVLLARAALERSRDASSGVPSPPAAAAPPPPRT